MMYYQKLIPDNMSLLSFQLTSYVADIQKPEIRHTPDSKFGKFIRDKCPIVHQNFSPTWWAGSSLLQTLVPPLFRSRIDILHYAREVITAPDGGALSVDWFEGVAATETNGDRSPIALIIPGLISDSQSEYLRCIVPRLHKLGYRVATFNNRGRGGLELRSPRLYCASNFDDVELVVNYLKERNPNSRIVATGLSMGGMVLTRYLAERGKKAKVDAAMLVSANFDLVNGTKNMENSMLHRFIARVMTKELVNILLAQKDMLMKAEKPVQWDKLKEATSFRELDKYFTCPMWGYNDPEDYFRDATNVERMPNIKVPTLALNSGDDIFSPYETLPLDILNEAVTFIVTHRGGHLGFMDGWRPTTPFYGDRLIEQYHEALLGMEDLQDLVRQTETRSTANINVNDEQVR